MGRPILRLYLESHRADGTTTLSLAASEDGRVFQRLLRPVVEEVGRRHPAPVVVDERVTLLFHTAPRTQGDLEMRGLVVGVAPRTVTIE